MRMTVTYSEGNVVMIEKANGELGGYIERVTKGIEGKAQNFIPSIKLLMYNRLGGCLPINHLTDSPEELFYDLGFDRVPNTRSFYRVLERLGKALDIVLHNHQEVLVEYGLISDKQFIDFSSTYFEGEAKDVGEYGYSRDNQPNKKQITFGISPGINGIPTAITIQKGNVQDKMHFRFMLKAVEATLPKSSILIFDCGANTKG